MKPVLIGCLRHRCQHMFINPANPRSAFGMAYNCVASPDNSCTFNDGYHILHHLNSMTHWSDLPQRFIHYLDQHVAQEGASSCQSALATCKGDSQGLESLSVVRADRALAECEPVRGELVRRAFGNIRLPTSLQV